MTSATSRAEGFRRSIEVRADTLLTTKGFRHVPDLDLTTPTVATTLYLGTNVALEFSLDLRDDDVDVEVIRVEEGRLVPAEDGGYSDSLFSHLVQRCGYRGSPYLPSQGPDHPDRIERAIDGLVGLLNHPSAGAVLNDDPTALPD